MLEIKAAGFSYNARNTVFDHINFQIRPGEIVTILGPNGAGKSTLLKCINRILTLKTGDILFNQESLLKIPRKKIGTLMGYVSQSEESTFPFNALEMVLMGRAAHLNIFQSPGDRDRTIAESAMQYLGIEHLSGRLYKDLSGGESQLVTIARALSAEPGVLLLDEPTSHLDLKNQMTVLKALIQLSREKGLAVLMTTHQPDHAMVLSDRVLMMKMDGTALFGKTADIITPKTIQDIFGIRVNILSAGSDTGTVNTVVPDWAAILSKKKGS